MIKCSKRRPRIWKRRKWWGCRWFRNKQGWKGRLCRTDWTTRDRSTSSNCKSSSSKSSRRPKSCRWTQWWVRWKGWLLRIGKCTMRLSTIIEWVDSGRLRHVKSHSRFSRWRWIDRHCWRILSWKEALLIGKPNSLRLRYLSSSLNYRSSIEKTWI